MCFHITKYTYPIRQIPAFISLNTYLTIIKHVHSFHRTHISPLHYVGVYVYAGTINRTPTAADGLQQRCERFTNNVTPTHETPHKHSARRRGPIHRARILTLSITCIHVIKYVFPFHRKRISPSITCVFPYTRAR